MPGRRFLPATEVYTDRKRGRTGRYPFTRQTGARLIKEGKFPAPHQIGDALVAWAEDELDAYDDALPRGLREFRGRPAHVVARERTGEDREPEGAEQVDLPQRRRLPVGGR